MANSISNTTSANAAITTLLRAQSTGVASLKPSSKASQTIIDQLQSTKIASGASNSSAPSGNLPRGSLVDLFA
jgi:hypothetical protein